MFKPSIEPTQNCYAICVGINRYNDPRLKPLCCAENDAQAMYNLFLERGFLQENCCLLIGSDASLANIRAALKNFVLTQPKKNDLVIFYFAGHGVRIPEPVDEEDSSHSDVFLACQDMNTAHLFEQRGEWLEYTLRLGELRQGFFERSNSKQLLFILDSCHSGDFFGERYRDSFSASELISSTFSSMREGRVVLSSCMPDQLAYENTRAGHGTFTLYLLQALRGEQRKAVTRQGKLTISSLFDYLSTALPPRQRPVESGVKHGSFELWYFPEFDEDNTNKFIKQEAAEAAHIQAQSSIPPFILPLQDREEFTGRAVEMDRLKQLLLVSTVSKPAIACILGTGGMGKSTLACHFANTYRSHFPDGIIGMSIEGRDPTTLARIFADHMSNTLSSDLPFSTGEIMQRVFYHKRALLIFDNCDFSETKNNENLELRTKLRQLLPGGKCSVIITTRDRSVLANFGLQEEACISLQHFTKEESLALLTRLLGKECIAYEAQAAEELHEIVGGLPLALHIASSMFKEEWFDTLKTYVEQLRKERDELERLPELRYADLDIRATFNLSIKLLSKLEKNLFSCLGACSPEGFSLTTAQVVSKLSKEDTHKAMAKLYRLSLVNKQTNNNRFVLHPLLYMLARELAHIDGVLDAAEARHTNYFIAYVQEHNLRNHERNRHAIHINAMTREIEAILLTMRRLLTTDIDEAVAFYISLEPFLQSRGYWEQAMELINERLRIAEAKGDYYNSAHALIQRGQFLQLQGHFSKAEEAVSRACETAKRIHDRETQQRTLAKALNSLGAIYPKLKRLSDAAHVLQEAASIEEQLHNLHGKGVVLSALGKVYGQMQQQKRAIQVLEESYDLLYRTNDLKGQAMVLNSLGVLYQRQGDLEEAREVLLRSWSIGEELGLSIHVTMVLNTLGQVYDRLGNFSDAIDVLQKSLNQRILSKDQRGEAITRCTLGKVLFHNGKIAEAIEHLILSFEIDERLKNRNGLRIVTPALIEALTKAGRIEDVEHYRKRSKRITS